MHAIVRAALHQAVRWGLVSRNVASLASPPSQPQREQHPPTAADVVALIEAADALEPMFGLYVRVVAATGMRRSEACGLRWSDIDLEDGRLVVQRSHLSLPGAVGDRPTKTRSVRTVTLDPDTVAALTSAWLAARHLARFAGVDDDRRRAGYVFSFDADGASAWRGDTVDSRWARTRRAAGVTGVRLHDLRHWQATQLLDAGVPVPTVAARLGHADGTTTMKIYAHRTVRGDEMAAAGGRGGPRRDRSTVELTMSSTPRRPPGRPWVRCCSGPTSRRPSRRSGHRGREPRRGHLAGGRRRMARRARCCR